MVSVEVAYEKAMPLNADSCETLQLRGVACASNSDGEPVESFLVAVGMYQLDEATQKREGKIQFFDVRLTKLQGTSVRDSVHVTEGVEWDLPGVFDAKWRDPSPSAPSAPHHLGVAAADGRLKVYSVHRDASQGDGGDTPSVSRAPPLLCEGDSPTDGTMALVLEWSRGAQRDRLCCSYSSGEVAAWRLEPAGALRREAAWQAHSLEAWSCAFHPMSDPEAAPDAGYLVWTGGDDCAFHLWDLRQGTDLPAASLKRAHAAGVCCIAPSVHTGEEHLVFTGSYDEYVRMWDLRTVGSGLPPKVLAQEGTGGGVWRLRHREGSPGDLFAACMYNGYATLSYSAALGTLSISKQFDQTGALCYGADWLNAKESGASDGPDFLATASFYDKRFSIWKIEA